MLMAVVRLFGLVAEVGGASGLLAGMLVGFTVFVVCFLFCSVFGSYGLFRSCLLSLLTGCLMKLVCPLWVF